MKYLTTVGIKMKKLIFVLSVICASSVLAHSGGTDARGCHHDHIHGGYHCH